MKTCEQKCNSYRILFTTASQNTSIATQRDRQRVFLHSHDSGNLSHSNKQVYVSDAGGHTNNERLSYLSK